MILLWLQKLGVVFNFKGVEAETDFSVKNISV